MQSKYINHARGQFGKDFGLWEGTCRQSNPGLSTKPQCRPIIGIL